MINHITRPFHALAGQFYGLNAGTIIGLVTGVSLASQIFNDSAYPFSGNENAKLVTCGVSAILGSFAGTDFYNDVFNLGHHFAASSAELELAGNNYHHPDFVLA